MDCSEMESSINWHIQVLIDMLKERKTHLCKQIVTGTNINQGFARNNEVTNENSPRKFRFESVYFERIRGLISDFGKIVPVEERKLQWENSDKIENYNSAREVTQKIKVPHGIAYHEITNYIYVADWGGRCIHVYSKEAKHISLINIDSEIAPCCLAVRQKSMYITDNVHHTIHKLELRSDYITMVEKSLCEITSKLNMKELSNIPLKSPRGIVIGSDNTVYVADSNNNRIIMIHAKNKVEILQDKTNELFCPVDLDMYEDNLYIMCWVKGRGVHIIKREPGNKPRVIFRQFHVNAFFFSVFGESVLFSDIKSHKILIFKLEEGKDNEKALKEFPKQEEIEKPEKIKHVEGYFYYPSGVAVISESKFVAVSSNMKIRLQIFQFGKYPSTPM